ncbi:hypothetical protein NMY22_g13163 [Coprinellus aureogranulatus]|nr:hypothetical protein NMY22_g13163 [Coprinellus aureogranulatus]
MPPFTDPPHPTSFSMPPDPLPQWRYPSFRRSSHGTCRNSWHEGRGMSECLRHEYGGLVVRDQSRDLMAAVQYTLTFTVTFLMSYHWFSPIQAVGLSWAVIARVTPASLVSVELWATLPSKTGLGIRTEGPLSTSPSPRDWTLPNGVSSTALRSVQQSRIGLLNWEQLKIRPGCWEYGSRNI